MKERRDDAIQAGFTKGLKDALRVKKLTPERAAALLEVELGTMYKYLAGNMIPGGQVLWRACFHLGTVLNRDGFRAEAPKQNRTLAKSEDKVQRELPFLNESLDGKKVHAHVHKKNEYVRVSLKIKVAG